MFAGKFKKNAAFVRFLVDRFTKPVYHGTR